MSETENFEKKKCPGSNPRSYESSSQSFDCPQIHQVHKAFVEWKPPS